MVGGTPALRWVMIALARFFDWRATLVIVVRLARTQG
jgi:hypothetical protein